MPTFDFACKKCEHVFEFTRPFGSKELPPCPKCGSKKTEKLLSPPAVHFKGAGWYKTDSGGKAASTSKKAEKTATETSNTSPSKDPPALAPPTTPSTGDMGSTSSPQAVSPRRE
jgi:putative FmdB family regulatory protein